MPLSFQILSKCFPMAFLDAILVEVRESRSTTVRIRYTADSTLLLTNIFP